MKEKRERGMEEICKKNARISEFQILSKKYEMKQENVAMLLHVQVVNVSKITKMTQINITFFQCPSLLIIPLLHSILG